MNLKAKARGLDVPYTSQLRAGGGSIVLRFPLLVQNGHDESCFRCLLSRVKRTLHADGMTLPFDPNSAETRHITQN
jgi:hypothetical protein